MDKLPPRLSSKLQINNTTKCWEWIAVRDKHGYGRFSWKYKTVFSHRLVYELLVGATKLELDHKCRNPACSNPEHLEPVTHKENVRRGLTGQASIARYAKHLYCPKNHPLFGNNLYSYVMKNGYINKQCRTCRRDSKRRRRANGAVD